MDIFLLFFVSFCKLQQLPVTTFSLWKMEEAASNPPETSNHNSENEIELSLQVVIVPNEHLCSLEQRTRKSPKLLKSRAAQKSCSIFRVPQNILDLHPRSFQPGIVSIGPYYHGEKKLQMMEEHKCRILGFFLDQLQEFGVVLDHLYQAIKEKEDQIRACYSQNIDKYSSGDLIEMMILDGCFIIQLLCVVGRIIIPESDDPIFNFPWMQSSITRDLLMLENQIPFFVLQILYDKSVADHIIVPPLQELILTLINYSLPRYSKASKLCHKYKDFRGEHILDFYRSTYIPSSEIDDRGDDREKTNLWSWCCCCCCSSRKEKTTARGDSLQSLPKEETANDRDSLLSSSNKETMNPETESSPEEETANQGDSVEVLSGNDRDSLLTSSNKETTTDRRNSRNSGNGENMNPENSLESTVSKREETSDQGDSEELLSENEETRDVIEEPRGWGNKLCGLVGIRLKQKAETDEDLLQFIQPVEKLLQAGIKFKKREDTDSFLDIDFSHGALRMPLLVTDQEPVNFFNEVGKNIPYYFKEDYLMKVAEKVEIYYRNAWHVGWAEFKYAYCGSVWVCLSASAALLVILLTALQTFYAVYAYHNPS
ncbi:uncharacterized protein [Euphorbia lathyris]|uniref:uncharacterized protein n=1 Tax=Euphorbia lathyris TaxID=212925 RepID=UPI003313B350